MSCDTCGTCKYWLADLQNVQDRKMLEIDRRPCSLAKDLIDRSRFFYKTTPACRKYAVELGGYHCG